jgi:hypothetical protein
MKKITATLFIFLFSAPIFAAAPVKAAKTALQAPTATATSTATAVPSATATPKLSAIELYRQMTGRQAERVFPTATPGAAVNEQLPAPKAGRPAGMTATGWFLISADAALAGWAVFSLIDFNNSVDAYERLKSQLDVPPYANYDFLIREQEKANSKVTITAIAWSLAGVCAAYTIADLVWLHSAFPVQAGAAYEPLTGAVMARVSARF